MNIDDAMRHPARSRTGTHNCSSLCIHLRSMKTDNCRDCILARGWVIIEGQQVDVEE